MEKPISVVMLDFDGVINSVRHHVFMEIKGAMDTFDPVCVAGIKYLCKECNAKIVCISSWRLIVPNWRDYLKKYGLFEYLHEDDHTLDGRHERGSEVAEWLGRHPEITKYVIIDDTQEFTEEQQSHFVQPDCGDGFGYDDYIKAKKILGGKESPVRVM